jgi:hypothetical protein
VDVVVQVILRPGFGDALLELTAAGFDEGFPCGFLGRSCWAEEVGVFVEQRGKRFAVPDEGGGRLLLARVFVQVTERGEDLVIVEVERAVPMSKTEDRAGGPDHAPVPRGLLGIGEASGGLPARRQQFVE